MFKLPVKVKHQETEYTTDYEGSVGEIALKLLQDVNFFKESQFAVSKEEIHHEQLARFIRHKLSKAVNFHLV